MFNQSKDYVSAKLARQIYYSFVYSQMNYGIEDYGSCAKTSLEKLQILQNKLRDSFTFVVIGLNSTLAKFCTMRPNCGIF